MPRYSYKARSFQGEEEAGTIEAHDKRDLARILRQKGYFLVSIEGEAEKKKGRLRISELSFFKKLTSISLTEKLFFTKNLMVMIKTGIPLPRAFEMLATQAKNKKFKKALNEISGRIIKGESFSDALGAFPKIFPPIYQETVRVGEGTGKLDETLRILSTQMEREHSLRSKIKTAMVYPIMVLGMTFVIGAFMMVFAVPKLKEAFEELGVDLPVTTQTVLAFADFLTKKWSIAIPLIAAVIFVLFLAQRTKRGKKLKSKLVLKVPIIAKIAKQTNSALTLRTLSSLLKSGVPVVRSLEVSAGALNNFYFRESLKEAAKVVEKGEKVSEALKPYEKLYPPMVLQMLEVGEETGETPEILEKLADFYEEEASATTQKLSSLLEPILIMFIGGAVGFFAVSMMQPMFSVLEGIH